MNRFMELSLGEIWAWFADKVLPAAAIFVIWLVAVILVVIFFGFLFNRDVTKVEKVLDDATLNSRERRLSKALFATVAVVTMLCSVAILARVGWIAMLVALVGMAAVLVIAYNMVD